MTAIRAKDRLFLAFAVPIAAVAAYVWLWRIDAARAVAALEARSAALVSREDFAAEKRLADMARAAAERELAAERSAPPPAAEVKGDPAESAAERGRAVLAVLREAGVWVVKSEDAQGGDAGEALKATGTRPKPRCRRYVLDGTYPAVKKALDEFAARKMAAVPERIAMKEAGGSRWTMEIWE